MPEKWINIDRLSPMFDFQAFYQWVVDQLPDDCRVVEVGVSEGRSLIYLAEALVESGKKFRLIGVDDCSYGGDNQRNSIMRNLLDTGLANVVEFWSMDSLKASCKFPGNYLDFVFLDSSHLYEETKAEILLWHRKIRGGGILAGHDYHDRRLGVYRAVNELIPESVTRPQLDDTIFEPTQVRNIYETINDAGVWWTRKEWFVSLNQ